MSEQVVQQILELVGQGGAVGAWLLVAHMAMSLLGKLLTVGTVFLVARLVVNMVLAIESRQGKSELDQAVKFIEAAKSLHDEGYRSLPNGAIKRAFKHLENYKKEAGNE